MSTQRAAFESSLLHREGTGAFLFTVDHPNNQGSTIEALIEIVLLFVLLDHFQY
jgi:hypothetical protein